MEKRKEKRKIKYLFSNLHLIKKESKKHTHDDYLNNIFPFPNSLNVNKTYRDAQINLNYIT